MLENRTGRFGLNRKFLPKKTEIRFKPNFLNRTETGLNRGLKTEPNILKQNLKFFSFNKLTNCSSLWFYDTDKLYSEFSSHIPIAIESAIALNFLKHNSEQICTWFHFYISDFFFLTFAFYVFITNTINLIFIHYYFFYFFKYFLYLKSASR